MTAALVVYALAALTVFALLYRHAIGMAIDPVEVFLAALTAALWPLYVPALAIDWVLHRPAARRGSR